MRRHFLIFLFFAGGIGVVVFIARSNRPSVNSDLAAALPTTAAEIVRVAASDTLIHWYDEIQGDVVNIFQRTDYPILPNTPACDWVRSHRQEAIHILTTDITTEFNLGWAVLAGFLEIRSLLPKIIEEWTKIDDDVAYNGESPISGRADLSYFRASLGVAYVIEYLARVPLKQAVELTPSQRKRLRSRAAANDEVAIAILDAVN